MRLGSSIRRRRFRSDGRSEWPKKKWWAGGGPLRLSRDAGYLVGGVLLVGFLLGYFGTTRLLFPA
ncbi:MAG TPA: hypothetical protein DCE19_02015, partial [Gemmatimonadetes bacterium]|nr:hypothetical protein [Gemmatimonadota bacterium]